MATVGATLSRGLREEEGDLKEEAEGEVQELRTEDEQFKIEDKTAGLNLQDSSETPSPVS